MKGYETAYTLQGEKVYKLIHIDAGIKPRNLSTRIEKILNETYKTAKRDAPQFGLNLDYIPAWERSSWLVVTKPTKQWTVRIYRQIDDELLKEDLNA